MSKETLDYNASHDDAALWTGTMFGGMPTFLIHLEQWQPVRFSEQGHRVVAAQASQLSVHELP